MRYEYGALVEWFGEEKTEVLGGEPVQAPVCTQQISCGLASNWTEGSAPRAWQLTA